MKKVRIAQVGSSHDHARDAFRTLRSLADVFEIVGFAEFNPNVVVPEEFGAARRYSVDELLRMDDLEAVAVECEEESATEIALRFAEKGIAVYLDKPGSQNIALFERLISLVQEKQIPFAMGYMYRYNPSVIRLYDMIARGELGEIFSVEAHMDCWHNPQKRQWLKKHTGGMMYFLGCHLIDVIYRILGEPERVVPMNMSTGLGGVTGEDYGFAVMQYKNGLSFAKTCACEVNGFLRRQLVVTGTKGTYEIRPWENYVDGGMISPTTFAPLTDEVAAWNTNAAKQLDPGLHDRYADMLRDFARFVRGKSNPYTPEYELKLFRLVMQCCGYREE